MADNEGEPIPAAEEQPTGDTTEVPLQEGEAAPEKAAEEPAAEETAAAEQPSSEEAGEKPEKAEPSDEPTEAPPTEAADAEAEPVAATEEGEAPPASEGEGQGQAEAPAEGEAAEGEATAEGEEAGGETEQKEGEGEGEAQAVEGAGGEEKPEGEGEGGEDPAERETKDVEGEEKPEEEGEAVEEEDKTEEEAGEEGEEEEAKSPVPQSDTFAEGEAPEEDGTLVGEKLSRGPTPVIHLEGSEVPDRLEAGTPNKDDEYRAVPHEIREEEEEEVEKEEEPMYDREVLIEKYHNALADRETLLQQNYQLQHKLADYFRKKKNDERQDYDKNITDQEQRYLKYMAQLDELHQQDYAERESYQLQMEELKARCEDRRHRVDEERQRFVEFKKQVAINAINSRSGKPIAPKDIEQYLVTENKKEAEVVNVRLENIKLKNKLKKKEQQLKSKEELAEGLHLIDFEQLKIENQTYNEKIEERNEELLKLRKKITSTVQVLTHLKEKLQFVQGENLIQKGNLQEVEAEVAQKRDILSRTKQARDMLRIDNQRLRQNCGLLGNESLLRDFEERKDESDELKDKLERLKMQHAELTLNCNQVRRKIEQARVARQ